MTIYGNIATRTDKIATEKKCVVYELRRESCKGVFVYFSTNGGINEMESSASNTAGTFYGVGVGPGDPELLTVKAINAIKKVDVIIAPKTEKKEGSVALSIAKPYLRSDVEIVYQTFPMVKGFEDFHKIFENNKREIIKFLNDGKDVAFLTLGDPMFFSTYIYIFRLLKDCGIKIKTIF